MINKFITFSIITLLSLAATPTLAQSDPYNGYSVQHFTDENGLPQNSINDLVVDNNGFLWLASQVGLIRFNGSAFKLFYPADKRLMESNVFFLGRNNTGKIYFQTNDRDLYSYPGKDNHTLDAVNTASLQSPYLLNTRKQLFNFTHFLSDSLHPQQAAGRKLIFKELALHNQNFYAIDSSHLYLLYKDTLYYYGNNQLEKLAGFSGNTLEYLTLGGKFYILEKDSVLGVYENGLRTTLAGPIGGDLLRNGPAGKRQLATYRLFTGEAVHLQVDNQLYRITADLSGKLSAQYLLNLDFATRISTIDYNKGLDLLMIATTNEGFYLFHRSRFQSPALPDTLRQELAQYLTGPIALYHGEDILTKRFIFNMDGKFTQGQDPNPVWQKCIFIDQKENVWGAVFNLPRKLTAAMKTVRVFPTVDGQIVDYAQDEAGDLYCLTTRSLYRLQADSFKLLLNKGQFAGVTYGDNESLCIAGPHRLWIANTNGLYEYDPVSNTTKAIPDLAGAHVRCIHKCNDGSILLGTYGQGYFYYHHDRFYRMPLDKNGFLITAHCFLEDRHEDIWIPCNKGLFKVPKADMDSWCDSLSSQVYYYYYGRQDGLKTNEFNGGYNAAGLITRDGFIALLSMKGLVYFNVDSLRSDFPRGRIEITRAEIDGKSCDNTSTIELPPDYNSLVLEVSCPFLGNRNNLYLEYSLKGLTDEWRPVPDDGLINLNRLVAGNYTLRIRKVNGFGRNNYLYRESGIIVVPHFYRTTWFSLVAIFTLLLLLALLVQLWLKLREKRHEVRVKADKLKGTVVALEETVEKLQESQKALLQTSKLREKLISLVIHDLRSPLRFLTMLASDLHDNQENFSHEEVKERTYWIKKGTHDIYNFSEDFLLWVTSQKNNFSIAKRLFPIKPLLQEIYDFFREQVQQKGNSIYYAAEEELNIHSDPHILITIIRNLVDNANKYTDQGKIMITAYAENSHIIISVSDTGKGMSSRQMEQFLQNDGLDDVKSGSQLGHKFVFDLTKRINGAVSIESTELVGTTVKLSFGRES